MNKKSSPVDYSKPTDFQEFKRRFLASRRRSREVDTRGQRERRDRAEE